MGTKTRQTTPIRTVLVCMTTPYRDYDDQAAFEVAGGGLEFDYRLVPAPGGKPVVRTWPAVHGRCAGGRFDRIDLAATRRQARTAADQRYALWSQVTAGTPTAVGWQQFPLSPGTSEQARQQAHAAFLAQPRVAAMLDHNAQHPAAGLDIDELDVLQAGRRTYLTYHGLAAAVGDALVTGMGNPAMRARTGGLAHRLGYLTAANARLDQPDVAAMLAYKRSAGPDAQMAQYGTGYPRAGQSRTGRWVTR